MAVKSTMWLIENRHLRFRKPEDAFKIKKVKNSVRFQPGKFISEVDVNNLIRTKWDIIIEGDK